MNRPLRLVLVLAALALPASATTYYVDRSHPAASDANPGSEALPWLTIQHAADTLVAGDTALVKAGSYPEAVVVASTGAAGQEIVLAAYPGHLVTLDGTGLTVPEWTGLFEILNASWVRVRGFHVAHSGPYGTSTGIQVDDSSHVVIEQNHTLSTASSGILVWGSSDVLVDGNEVEDAMTLGAASRNERITVGRTAGFEVRGNHVHHGDQTRGEGICLKDGSTYGSAHHNWVHHVPSVGIYLDAWTEPTHDIDVYSNRVHDVGGDGIVVASEQGGLLSNVRLFDNLSYHNRWLGLSVSDCCVAQHPMTNVQWVNNSAWGNGWSDWGGGFGNANPQATGLLVRNNALAGNLSFEITFEDVPTTGATLDHNLIDGWHGYPGELCGTDCQVGDPLWLDPASGDFHLRVASPAVDHGSLTGAPAQDFDDRPREALPDIGALELRRAVGGDFDRDFKSDLAVYHATSGTWYVRSSSSGSSSALAFGGGSYAPVARDYDGDVRSDIAVYHAASGLWFLRQASGTVSSVGFGGPGYAPVPADYDGDGQADVAVYHAASGLWFIRQSSLSGAPRTLGFGGVGYVPVPGDFDGDGRADPACFHAATGLWFVRRSGDGGTTALGFGGPDYVPVPGDYDGDHRTDLAVYHPATGLWFVRRSSDAVTQTAGFGGPGYTPVPGDYDGDGQVDLAVYHGATGLWFVRRTSDGATQAVGYGGSGFSPANQ